MPEISTRPVFILVVGLIVMAALVVRAGLTRVGLPPIVGYLLLGLALRGLEDAYSLFDHEGVWTLGVLGEIGVLCMLFKVGLDSNFQGLRRQFPNAVWIWLGNVVLSALLGYAAARFWLQLELIPSLFVATALSATSIGVSLSPWEESGHLQTDMGEVLTNAAELDDLSTVVLLVLLFAMVPILEQGGTVAELQVRLAGALVGLLAKGAFFALVCIAFARYLERPVTAAISRHADPVLFLVASGFILAALAGWLGFSVAIGGLFAGLIFSRDPAAVRDEASFAPIYDFFKPFFFVWVGFQIDPSVLHGAVGPALILLGAAIVGKVVGAAVPARRRMRWSTAVLIGVSLVPRAEIALLVAESGNRLGESFVPDDVFASLALVCLVTCLLVPPVLQVHLRRQSRPSR